MDFQKIYNQKSLLSGLYYVMHVFRTKQIACFMITLIILLSALLRDDFLDCVIQNSGL